MAQDPYGYKETAAPAMAAGDGASTMWMGFSSLICCAVGPCMCQMPFLVAFPLGLYAAYSGYLGLGDRAGGDGNDRAMNMTGLIGGLVSAGVSGIYLLFWAMYILLIVFVMGAGMLEQ